MATLFKEFTLGAGADAVWDALADFGALHARLVPGFVTETKLDSDTRIVTFSNGSVAREQLVTRDAGRRRLVYGIESERLEHHSASAQVVEASDGTCRFLWITDVLPDAIAPYIDGQMDLGMEAMKKQFGG
ncbi:MAG TPA: SRPBCC family protein [Rhizomicrobium sp.]|nr:SRPBCC family protein [Rhizomicrobium sp.]